MKNTRGRSTLRRIEIMDTTLRDGEQAEGISMMPEEKRTIARRLLEAVKVDRIEVASARVSEGERLPIAMQISIGHARSRMAGCSQAPVLILPAPYALAPSVAMAVRTAAA